MGILDHACEYGSAAKFILDSKAPEFILRTDFRPTSFLVTSDDRVFEDYQIESEQCRPPNTFLLALGLLMHPDRQRSVAGDGGRSAEVNDHSS